MNELDRSHDVSTLGYTPKQAAFLGLVAVHGGYFLRRQYVAFLDNHEGGTTTALTDRLVALGHAVCHVGARDTRLYHLRSRAIYSVLGVPDSRNRRPAPPPAIVTKLMTLDLVLRWRDRLVLGTEEEKVRFFTEDWHLPLRLLPATSFPSSRPGGGVAVHYFVDRSPIAMAPGRPEITVGYVQGWHAGTGGFAAFCRQYEPLLTALPSTRILFCTGRTDSIDAARRTWTEVFAGRQDLSGLVGDRALAAAHFRRRREAERSHPGAVTTDGASSLVDGQPYRSPAWEALYQRWRAAGDAVLQAIQPVSAPSERGPIPLFDVHVFRHLYPVLRGRADQPSVVAEASGAADLP
jgi:hypothetical protein